MNIKKIIQGIRCGKCYPRVFGEMVDDSDNNLYIYLDLGGNTRCFCKKHMSYGKEGSPALLDYESKWDYPCWGAKLKTDILQELNAPDLNSRSSNEDSLNKGYEVNPKWFTQMATPLLIT